MKSQVLIGVCGLGLQRVLEPLLRVPPGYAWQSSSHAAFGEKDTVLGPVGWL